jgi:alpha-amylase
MVLHSDLFVPLADLRTEDQIVRDMYGAWISEMVANHSIDGLRIDTSLNVEPSFFTDFVNASGVFATGEVMYGDDSVVCQWAETIGSILNYPIYYPLVRAFQSTTGSINDLVETINSVKQNCPDPTAFGSFSENHDVPRFANYTEDLSLAKNIITYTIMADGIPIIYQGQEQHMNGNVSPYLNRAPLWDTGYDTSAPLYEHIATLNRFRKQLVSTCENYTTYMNEVIYEDLHNLVMRKGYNGSQVITVLTNDGEDQSYFVLPVGGHGYPAGTPMTEIMTCTNFTVNETGYINVEMMAGTPKVMYPTKLLYNSSLCNMPLEANEYTSTTVTTQISTTIQGTPTAVSTTEISPVPISATTTASSSQSSHTSAHSFHRVLGGSQALIPSMNFVVTAAAFATAVASGRPHHGHRHMHHAARQLLR